MKSKPLKAQVWTQAKAAHTGGTAWSAGCGMGLRDAPHTPGTGPGWPEGLRAAGQTLHGGFVLLAVCLAPQDIVQGKIWKMENLRQ